VDKAISHPFTLKPMVSLHQEHGLDGLLMVFTHPPVRLIGLTTVSDAPLHHQQSLSPITRPIQLHQFQIAPLTDTFNQLQQPEPLLLVLQSSTLVSHALPISSQPTLSQQSHLQLLQISCPLTTFQTQL
jgi:hypothetical protein